MLVLLSLCFSLYLSSCVLLMQRCFKASHARSGKGANAGALHPDPEVQMLLGMRQHMYYTIQYAYLYIYTSYVTTCVCIEQMCTNIHACALYVCLRRAEQQYHSH